MKTSENLERLIRDFMILDIQRANAKGHEFYEAVNRLSEAGIIEANQHIKDNDFEEAAKIYLLISKILEENAQHNQSREVSMTLLQVASSWQRRAFLILKDAVNYYIRKSQEDKEVGNYEKATKYMNRVEVLEYQIKNRPLNNDLELEILNYYDSIRAEVTAELDSHKPTKILTEKAAWIPKKLGLIKGKPEHDEETLPEAKAIESIARGVFSPEKISIDNDFRRLGGKNKGWYSWSVFLKADDYIKKQIDSVTYTLHPTFPHPERTVSSGDNPDFRLRTQGWGEFQIKADIHLKSGETISKYHWLNLGKAQGRSE